MYPLVQSSNNNGMCTRKCVIMQSASVAVRAIFFGDVLYIAAIQLEFFVIYVLKFKWKKTQQLVCGIKTVKTQNYLVCVFHKSKSLSD